MYGGTHESEAHVAQLMNHDLCNFSCLSTTNYYGRACAKQSPKSAGSGSEAELTRLAELVVKTEERKRTFRATRDYKSTLEATETLKNLRAKIAAARRALEPVEMSCPFCLWRCSALFVAA